MFPVYWIVIWMTIVPLIQANADAELCPDVSSPEALDAQVHHCVKKAERFLRKNSTYLDPCREFTRLSECARMINSCPSVQEILNGDWKNFFSLMSCACINTSAECTASLHCTTEERKGIFYEECAERFNNDIQQKTNNDCHFMNQFIHCGENIIRSSCGDRAGKFYFLAMTVEAKRDQCEVRRKKNYPTFEYSQNCPRNLTEELDTCLAHLKGGVLNFHNKYSMISTDPELTVRNACSAFNNYINCMDGYNRSCPFGVKSIMAGGKQVELRLYIQKMTMICKNILEDYATNIQCLSKAAQDNFLSKCKDAQQNVHPLLGKITAYEYYCASELATVQELKKSLLDVRKCHVDAVDVECQPGAGRALGPLIDTIFEDPYYLNLGYKPYCDVHQPDQQVEIKQELDKKTDNVQKGPVDELIEDKENEDSAFVVTASIRAVRSSAPQIISSLHAFLVVLLLIQ